MNNCNAIGVQDINDVEIDNLASAPDYFLGVRSVVDPHSGDMVDIAVRVPGEKVMPNGNNDNIFSLETLNPALNVPEGQVLPCYLQNNVARTRIMPADANHPADFLVLKVDGELAYCQSVSLAWIPSGHDYEVYGAQYYLGNDGTPVTDSTQTGQKLFKPINKYQLLINI